MDLYPGIRISVKLIIVVSILAIILGIILYVPPNMDIFLPYQPIACSYYPFEHLVKWCNGRNDLTVAGFIHWPRCLWSQGFGGLSLFYLPLFLLFPHWQSAIVMGGIWLILTILLYIKISGVNPWVAFLVYGVNFFFVYNILYDACPIGFQMTIIFAIPWLATLILKSERKYVVAGLNLILGVCVFLCVEYRPIFLYFLPASLLITLMMNKAGTAWPQLVKRLALKCLPAMILCIALSLFIIFGRLPNGKYYWQLLRGMNNYYPPFSDFTAYLIHVKNLVATYLLNFPNSGGIVYGQQDLRLVHAPFDYKGGLVTLPFWLIALYLVTAFYRCRKDAADREQFQRYHIMVTTFFLAGLISLLLVSINMLTRHAFHLIPPMAFGLGAIALCVDYLYRYRRINLACVAVLLAISQIFCTVYVVRQKPLSDYAWDRLDAIAYTEQPEISNHAFISNLNWGTYFIASLYGPKAHIVDYNEGLGGQELTNIIKLAHDQQRYMVFICQKTTAPYFQKIKDDLPGVIKLFPAPGVDSQWEVWGEAGILNQPAAAN